MNDKHDELGRFAEKDYERKIKETLGIRTELPRYEKQGEHYVVKEGLLQGQSFATVEEINEATNELNRKIDKVVNIINDNIFKHEENGFTSDDFAKLDIEQQKNWIRTIEKMEMQPELAKSFETASEETKNKILNDIKAFWPKGLTEGRSDIELWQMYLEKRFGGK